MTAPITFDLDSSDYNAHLGFDVLLNDNVVFTTEHVTELTTVTVEVNDDVDTENELKFVLKNKTQDHTKVDEQGNILSDAMLSISNIAFDEVKLGHMFIEQTVYHHDMNGSQDLTEFQFYNKTQDHTKVDEQGNILSDAMLSISNIAFDEIKLGHMFITQTVYHHDMNGSQDLFEDKFYGSMGCNGYVSLKFATPIYLWLLENM